MKKILAILVFINTFGSGIFAVAPDGIWKKMSEIQTMKADFTEEKHIALMHDALRSKGTFYFSRPDHLVREITEPFHETDVFQNGWLHITHHELNSTEKINLRQQPVAGAVFQHFVWMFGGNKAEIESHYKVSVNETDAGAVQLELVPLAAPLNKILEKITILISGQGLPESVRINETGGDFSLIRFSNVRYDLPDTAKPKPAGNMDVN